MTTFSQLVDSLVLETRRPDMRTEISTYLNQTIRELHFQPGSTGAGGNVIYYDENRFENQITATLANGQGWDVPNPHLFQTMLDVRYDTIWEGESQVHPPFLTPGRGMSGRRYFYYRAGSTYFFSGYGGVGGIISMMYYQYPARLKYFASGARPCEWDDETYTYTYDPAFDVDDDHRLTARQFCTNWILDRWEDVVSEGLRAKVYKRLSDDNRAKTCYSMFSQLRQGLFTSESSALGTYGS